MQSRLMVLACVVAMTAFGYFYFPGHTYLHSDTQIYVPMLDRLVDPAAYPKDFVSTQPHMAFTLYDEVTIGLQRLTGADFEAILTAQQVVWRACGFYGIYLFFAALGLGPPTALLGAAWFSLGATVLGPSVLTVEYEPVPRGFAIGLLYLALGLAAQERFSWAGVAAGAGFLYHPPTACAFYTVLLWIAAREKRTAWWGFAALIPAALLLALFARWQPGITEPQVFLRRIPQWMEKLQQLRASYNWVSLWKTEYYEHYAAVLLVTAIAAWRVWRSFTPTVRALALGLPAVGVLTVPLSYVLLERVHWALMPQFQPARAVLWISVMGSLLPAAAAFEAIRKRRTGECFAWLLPVFILPIRVLYTSLFDGWSGGLLIVALAAAGALVLWLERHGMAWPMVLAGVAPFLLIPVYGGVENYPHLETPALDEVAAWARANTPADAVFVFPDHGRGLQPGIFKVRARRALWVDWKGGGQVNYFEPVAQEWSRRWTMLQHNQWDPTVDYVVRKANRDLPGAARVFGNAEYWVFKTGR